MNRISLSVMLLVGIAALSCREQDKAAIPVFPLEGSVIPADSLQNDYTIIHADTNESLLKLPRNRSSLKHIN